MTQEHTRNTTPRWDLPLEALRLSKIQKKPLMDCNKHKKIKQIVRLQQILKKWKKLANAQKPSNSTTKGINFLKRTFTFSNSSSTTLVSGDAAVPKGFLAVCVGEELKRFVIPTGYLGHRAFRILLRRAEEEFGFQQEGVLRIPCDVSVFENILKVVRERRDQGSVLHAGVGFIGEEEMIGCCSLEVGMSQLLLLHQQPKCR